jgi:hypothetical protein
LASWSAGVDDIQTEWERTPEGLPICRKHREVMPRRKKQGDVWHSHRVIDTRTGEELYCRGYASPSSPSFSVPPEHARAFDDDTTDVGLPVPARSAAAPAPRSRPTPSVVRPQHDRSGRH